MHRLIYFRAETAPESDPLFQRINQQVDAARLQARQDHGTPPNWIALFNMVPALHRGEGSIHPESSVLFVQPGQEAIAADYLDAGVRCIVINPKKKTGRCFPLLHPDGSISEEGPGPDDCWQDYTPPTP